MLPTDLAFVEKEQRWVPVGRLPKSDVQAVAEFHQELEAVSPQAYVTPALIAVNVAVFLAMALTGVSIGEPTPAQLIHWGADFGPLVTSGQWWRLLTCSFVHVGLLHLGFNMWALFSGGIFTERLFGPARFLTLYLLAAVGGSLASILWQPSTVAAGASGAIFGVYGALIGLLIVQKGWIPSAAVGSLSANALGFVGYNLFYGLFGGIGNSHIDLAAHLGGLATGFLAGMGLAYGVDPRAQPGVLRRSLTVALVGLGVFIFATSRLGRADPRQIETLALEIDGKRLNMSNNNVLLYSGQVTVDDAKRLAQWLTDVGVMRGHGVLILLTKGSGGSVVSMPVRKEAWQKPEMVTVFQTLGMAISGVTGTPLKFRLLNTDRTVEKEFLYNHQIARP